MIYLSLVGGMLGLGFVGCERTSDDRGTPASKLAARHTELASIIKGVLDSDDQLRDANLNITADARKNEATLRGTVETEALRSKAIELAKSAQPGLTVNDNIEVKPRESARAESAEDLAKQEWDKVKRAGDRVGNTTEDAWLHGKILAKLISNPKTPARNINIDVVQGVVILSGRVSNAEEKSEAEKLARNTDGVKSVENRLEIGST
jgi:osmotically-inducible protein OsmY